MTINAVNIPMRFAAGGGLIHPTRYFPVAETGVYNLIGNIANTIYSGGGTYPPVKGDEWFVMDRADGPLYGFDSGANHPAVRSLIDNPTGAPDGGTCAELELVQFTNDHPSCDPGIGWTANSGITVPSQGGSVFWRYYVKYSAATATRNSGCGGGPWEGKIVILGGSDGERIIEQASPRSNSALEIKLAKNINDTWPSAANLVVADNTWHAVQCECQTSSTSSASDTEFRCWIDNDTYGSPTAELTGQASTNVAGWGTGFQFMQAVHALGNTDTLKISVVGIRTGPTFHNGWYSGMNG